MKILAKHALVFFLVVSCAVAQTAAQKVCDAAQDPSSPQCLSVNGVRQTTAGMPKEPARVVPAVTQAPTAPSVQEQSEISRWKTAEYGVQKQNARVEENPARVPTQVRLIAFQADIHDENGTPPYSAGNSLWNELVGAISRSVQMHKFHSYVRKTCERYGSGTSWVWIFSNGQLAQGTCD
jgi:hypothetical protein